MDINSNPSWGLHQFIWDHIYLSWPQTSSVPPFLTATSFPVCDHTGRHMTILCLIRVVESFCWGSTWAYLHKCSVQQLPWNLPQCSTSGPIWGTTYHLPEQLVGNEASPQSRIFCEICSLLPPDPSHVTQYLPLSTFTLHLHSNALVSRRYHVSSCLKAFAHAIPTTLNILSLPFHSPSSS